MADIETYRKMLPVMKHRLDDELEIQAQIMDDISRRVVVLNSRMLEAKDVLARTEARLIEDARESALDSKITKGEIESRVSRHPERISTWEKYQGARAEHEDWAGLLEAWRHKGYSIKTLADLYAADYFAVQSSTHNSPTSRHPVERDRHAPTDGGVRASMRRSFSKVSSEKNLLDPPVRRRGLIDE